MARFKPRQFIPRKDNASPWHEARRCDLCHVSPYPWGRCIKHDDWPVRNPGHRGGWLPRKLRICLRCVTLEKSERVLNLIQLPPPSAPTRRSA